MLVGERMSKPVITSRAETTLPEALDLMHKEHIRRLPVVNKRGELIGIADWIVAQGQGLGFAVALRHALSFAAQLRVTLKRAVSFPIDDTDASAKPGGRRW